MIVAISTSILLLWFTWQHHRRRRLPPGPFPLPLLGNLLELTRSKLPHQHLARLAREKFGPIMYLELGRVSTVVVSGSDVARDFLLTNDKLLASRPRMTAAELMDYGQALSVVMGAYGPRWRQARKFVSLHLFSPNCIASQKHVRREELILLLRDLRARANTDVDMTAVMTAMVQNAVCRTLLSRRMADMMDASCQQVGTLLQEMVRDGGVLFQVPIFGDFIPLLGFLDRAAKRSMADYHAKFDVAWELLIEERKKERREEITKLSVEEDLLDALLCNYADDKEALKACLSSAFVAALDTTSTSLDWTMAELLSNPTILEKLQAEMESFIGGGRLVEEEDLVRLPYVKAVVKESLRLHPPLPLGLPHMAMEACGAMGGQYCLRKGTSVMVNIWAIGRDPKVWPEPERFLPDRFVGATDALEIDVYGQQFDMIPFSSGRRGCPGTPMALLLLQLVVANLVHCFDWQASGTIDFSERAGAVSKRQESLRASPIPRLNVHY